MNTISSLSSFPLTFHVIWQHDLIGYLHLWIGQILEMAENIMKQKAIFKEQIVFYLDIYPQFLL